jgi:hypothetical protein
MRIRPCFFRFGSHRNRFFGLKDIDSYGIILQKSFRAIE